MEAQGFIHFGVLQILKKKYRWIVKPPNESFPCTITVVDINRSKWVGTTSLNSSFVKSQLSSETVGYKWVPTPDTGSTSDELSKGKKDQSNEYNQLAILIGKSWITLMNDNFTVNDSHIEMLIQMIKSSKADQDILSIKEQAQKDISSMIQKASSELASSDLRKEIASLKETLSKSQEDFQMMKQRIRYWNAFSNLRVACTSTLTNGAYANWNIVTGLYSLHNSNFYTVSGGQITFHKPGIYFVSAQISSTNTGNTNFISLYLNGNGIANSYGASNGGYYHFFHISRAIVITPGQYIQVYYQANSNNYPDQSENEISIISFDNFLRENAALCTRSTQAVQSGNMVNWDSIDFNTNNQYFNVNGHNITIRKTGWYIVALLMNSQSSDNNGNCEIRLEGKPICRSTTSNPNGFMNPMNFTDIVHISSGNNLSVLFTGNSYPKNDALSQQLSLISLPEDNISVLSLASTQAVTNGQYINWDVQLKANEEFYKTAANRITFLRGGNYLVCVNVCGRDTGNTGYVSIYVNGSDVSRTRFSNPSGHFQTVTKSVVLQIQSNQYLEIYYSSNQPSKADQLNTKLSIICVSAV